MIQSEMTRAFVGSGLLLLFLLASSNIFGVDGDVKQKYDVRFSNMTCHVVKKDLEESGVVLHFWQHMNV